MVPSLFLAMLPQDGQSVCNLTGKWPPMFIVIARNAATWQSSHRVHLLEDRHVAAFLAMTGRTIPVSVSSLALAHPRFGGVDPITL
jgi:hypothetical protein